MSKENAIESVVVRQLKQKLHKAFIDYSNIQSLHEQEMQEQRDKFQKIVRQLENQNLILKAKIKEFQPEFNDKSMSFAGFFELDQSVIVPKLKKKESFFLQQESFSELIIQNSIHELCQEIAMLERKIKSQFSNIPDKLHDYFQKCKILSRQTEIISRQLVATKQRLASYQQFVGVQERFKKQELVRLRDQNSKLKSDFQNVSAAYREVMKKYEEIYKNSSNVRSYLSPTNISPRCSLNNEQDLSRRLSLNNRNKPDHMLKQNRINPQQRIFNI